MGTYRGTRNVWGCLLLLPDPKRMVSMLWSGVLRIIRNQTFYGNEWRFQEPTWMREPGEPENGGPSSSPERNRDFR